MPRLSEILRLFWAWLNMPVLPSADATGLTPREWADLPPHHPICDCAPR